MQTVDQTRRDKLQARIKLHGSIAALNEALELPRTDSTLSQIRTQAKHSRTGRPRSMGDELARRIEEALKLPAGWMDTAGEGQALDPRVARIHALIAQLPEWKQDQVARIVEAFASEAPPAPSPAP
jgi:hypothetical protein